MVISPIAIGLTCGATLAPRTPTPFTTIWPGSKDTDSVWLGVPGSVSVGPRDRVSVMVGVGGGVMVEVSEKESEGVAAEYVLDVE